MKVSAIVFDGFETLDLFGPVEMLSASGECEVGFFSLAGGTVTGKHGVPVVTEPISAIGEPEAILVPGGSVDAALENDEFISALGDLAARAEYVLSVCNGAYLYAKAGALDGKLATTYKGHGLLDKACELFPQVKWQRSARWTVDGKCYVSSGISAGTDMSLGFIADVFGREKAEAAARYAEYTWNDDPANDPYAV